MLVHGLDTPVVFSSALAFIEIVGADAIKVTSSTGAEEVVNELVLTCPVPNVRDQLVIVLLSVRLG